MMNRSAIKNLALQIVDMHFPFAPNTHELRADVVADLIQRALVRDNIDTCAVCGKEIPPGPNCCSPECDKKLKKIP